MINLDSELCISATNVSKKFKLYKTKGDRIKDLISPLGKKYHEEFWALKNVNLNVCKGQSVAILGLNGSGKSTLLQIIVSVMQATSGEVNVQGNIAALLELGAGFKPQFTGRQNAILSGVLQGFSEQEMNQKMPEIEAFSEIGVFFDQPVATYSSGMFVRLAFAAAISVNPDIFVVDEALAVGDAKFQHKCFTKFKDLLNEGKTLIFVSHDVEVLLRICSIGIVLDKGTIVFDGEIKDAVNAYQNILYGDAEKVSLAIKETISSDTMEVTLLASNFEENTNVKGNSYDFCKEHPSYNPGEVRMGNGLARIIDYKITTSGSENPKQIQYGMDFNIFVKILFMENLEGVHFGFAIVSSDGVWVHGTNTQLQDRKPNQGDAGKVMEVRFGLKALFVGGDYFITLGVFRDIEQTEYLDERRSIAHIRFSSTNWCGGFIAFKPDFTVCEK